MQVFCINLDRDGHRLDHIRKHAEECGLDIERLPAVLGRAMPERLAPQFDQSPLSDSEIGCYASHLLCYEAIVARGLPYALVLEDDVEIEQDASEALAQIIALLPNGWDLVKVCNRKPTKPVKPVADLISGRTLVRYTRHPILAGAYLVSKAGAEKLLRPRPRTRPIDIDMHYPWLFGIDVYGVHPAIFPQSKPFGSNIEKTIPIRLNQIERIQGVIYRVRTIGLMDSIAARLSSNP